MSARRAIPALLCLAALTAGCGCGGDKKAPSDPPAPAPKAAVPSPAPAPEPAPAPAASAEKPAAVITATVTVLDGKGAPLPGMIPVITRQPNAFDEPVAGGAPTDASGKSVFTFPGTEKFCLRAWDPELNHFPNNYFDVEPVTENAATSAEVVMLQSAAIHGMLTAPDGVTAPAGVLRVMMYHPMKGPWWPARAELREGGVFSLPRVPAGRYIMQFECDAGRLRLEDVTLIPGGTLDLGPRRLEKP